MLVAFFVVSPLCVASLFAFANFADRTFRDALPVERKAFVEARVPSRYRDRRAER
ncbi:hypothetical protein [Candidatus Burkholderia verschuerenii]|uniref:hypothetical protein n=1 Tax=Candidatus Burkholderia verschuerenii TaxID=242163 RepID=UPI000A5631CB|nr:hypothetical protein [Candidatus Burkholderia verschuerenii]